MCFNIKKFPVYLLNFVFLDPINKNSRENKIRVEAVAWWLGDNMTIFLLLLMLLFCYKYPRRGRNRSLMEILSQFDAMCDIFGISHSQMSRTVLSKHPSALGVYL